MYSDDSVGKEKHQIEQPNTNLPATAHHSTQGPEPTSPPSVASHEQAEELVVQANVDIDAEIHEARKKDR